MRFERPTDPRSSEELLEVHRLERLNPNSDWEALSELQARGGLSELEMGRRLTQSGDSRDREIGADLLGQLGFGECSFQDEAVTILIHLLCDPDSDVVSAAAVGLGHRTDVRAVEPLVSLAARPEEDVRLGVVMGLLTQEDESAIRTLIVLSADPDVDVRNWATFGLGTQIESDTPAIREALAARLDDEDPEVRGEAIVGLANRRDARALSALPRELQREDLVVLGLEAAETLADPSLLPYLERLSADMRPDDNEYFHRRLTEAIAACRGELRSS